MKKYLFHLLFLATSLPGCSQNFRGQVFNLSQVYLPETCEVSASRAELFFYSNDRFVLTNYANSSDTSQAVGRYSIIQDTITLTFTKFGSDLLVIPINQDIPIRKNTIAMMKPERFVITNCNGKVILRNYNTKLHSYGARNERSESSWMNNVLSHKLYSKIKEELNRK